MTFSAASLALLPLPKREALIRSLSQQEIEQLAYCWPFWARPEQLAPPGDWDVWLTLAGRGWGKTRTGAEWICDRVARGARCIALAGRTADDVRDTMVERGILAIAPPWNRPKFEPSKRRLTWNNGAVATTYSADEPDQMRGPNTDTVWADELAAWQYPDSWDQLAFVLRSLASGLRPQAIVTTTPRATPMIRTLVKDPTTFVTRGSTFENAANVAPSWLARIRRKYEGTRLGRQELYAQVLDDAAGALWQREWLDALRIKRRPELRTIVIAVDPATTSGEDSDETGIIVAGLGEDTHGYVLADHSGRYSPNEWGQLVVSLYDKYEANRIVCEVNQGGDLVEANLRNVRRELPIYTVHAKHAKRVRAEPVAALYEQGRVHHVGSLAALEDQYVTWEPDVVEGGKHVKTDSPDRLDAAVYAITDLMIDRNPDAGRAQGGFVHGLSFEDRPVGD